MSSNKVGILVKRASLVLDKISNPMLSEYDLTLSQYKILKYLYWQPSKTTRMVDIEKYYSLTHPTTIGLLDNLERKGFITRIKNPNDARSKLISLTPKAEAMQSEMERLGDVFESKITQYLTKAEKERLVTLLEKLLKIDE